MTAKTGIVTMEQIVDITTLMEPIRACFSYWLLAMATMDPTGIPIVIAAIQIRSALSVIILIYRAVIRGMARSRTTVTT